MALKRVLVKSDDGIVEELQPGDTINAGAGSGFQWLGEWSDSITYQPNDVVRYSSGELGPYDDATWICVTENLNIPPDLLDDTYWNLLAGGATSTITSDLDLYITTTGNDTTGTGTSGNPWATLDKAFDWLSDYFILAPAIVTIHTEGGNYSDTDLLTFDHINGSQIQIIGDYETDTTCSLTSMTGSTKNWTIVFTTSNPSYYTLNDYILLKGSSGGTNTKNVDGVHKVTNIAGSSITVVSKLDWDDPASGAVTIHSLIPKTRLNRKLKFDSSINLIDGLQIVATPVTPTELILDVGGDKYLKTSFQRCVIASTVDQYGIGIGSYYPGHYSLSEIGISNTLYGLYTQSGIFTPQYCYIAGCYSGIYGIKYAQFHLWGTTIIGNTAYGIRLQDVSVYTVQSSAYILNNGINYSTTPILNIHNLSNDNAGTISICQAVYIKSNGNIDLAKADDINTANVFGLVYNDEILTNQYGNIQYNDILTATTGEWDAVTGGSGGLTVGAKYFLSNSTAGNLTATPPTTNVAICIGQAVSSTEMNIKIQPLILLN